MNEETQYDVFLSHNSQDKPAVERLARWLADEAGLRPFLDRWHSGLASAASLPFTG